MTPAEGKGDSGAWEQSVSEKAGMVEIDADLGCIQVLSFLKLLVVSNYLCSQKSVWSNIKTDNGHA